MQQCTLHNLHSAQIHYIVTVSQSFTFSPQSHFCALYKCARLTDYLNSNTTKHDTANNELLIVHLGVYMISSTIIDKCTAWCTAHSISKITCTQTSHVTDQYNNIMNHINVFSKLLYWHSLFPRLITKTLKMSHSVDKCIDAAGS